MTGRARVSVPASSGNLGAGFDVFGLAIDLRDVYEFQPDTRDAIEPLGKFLKHVPRDPRRNLAFRAFRSLAPATAGPFRLRATREIPPQGGLGGSASAIVGGLVAANHAFGLGLDNDELLHRANDIEGHPDNVAAALLGGLVLTVQTDESLHAVRVPFPSDIGIVVVVPGYHVPTARARAVLPADVSRSDAVANLGRAALFVAALQTGRYSELRVATQDFLHQPYRAELNPALVPGVRAALDAGAYGAALSGSGPTLIALAPKDHTMRVAGAMADVAIESSSGCETYVANAAETGASAIERAAST